MDLGSVLSLASSLQAQRTAQTRLEFTLSKVKEYQELQQSIVAQLLALMPSVNPDGVGGRVDLTV